METNIVGSTFIIILPLQVLASISSCMNRTETCPTKEHWNTKNEDYNCAIKWQYVCMLGKGGLLFEGCMQETTTIRFGTYGCPFVEQCDENFGWPLISHENSIPCEQLEQCPRENKTGIPVFRIKEFPECYVPKQIIKSEIFVSVNTTSPITIQEETSISGSGSLAVALIVPILIVMVVVGVVLTFKYRRVICFHRKTPEFASKSNSCEEGREAKSNEEDSSLIPASNILSQEQAHSPSDSDTHDSEDSNVYIDCNKFEVINGVRESKSEELTDREGSNAFLRTNMQTLQASRGKVINGDRESKSEESIKTKRSNVFPGTNMQTLQASRGKDINGDRESKSEGSQIETERSYAFTGTNMQTLQASRGKDLSDNNLIKNILEELSNHNRRNKERKDAMLSLMKITREGMLDSCDELFKAVLLILLETLEDDDCHIRALSLWLLMEILRNQPNRFKDYAELTILRRLEAHKDTVRDVERSAEECADTLANYIPPEQSVRILSNIIAKAQFPVNLAAIKMQKKVIELLPKDTLENQLQDIIPCLLRGYDDSVQQVRKAAVFCLVAIHASVGDVILNHLNKLTNSKKTLRLLQMYFKRNLQKRESTGATDT